MWFPLQTCQEVDSFYSQKNFCSNNRALVEVFVVNGARCQSQSNFLFFARYIDFRRWSTEKTKIFPSQLMTKMCKWTLHLIGSTPPCTQQAWEREERGEERGRGRDLCGVRVRIGVPGVEPREVGDEQQQRRKSVESRPASRRLKLTLQSRHVTSLCVALRHFGQTFHSMKSLVCQRK